MQVPSHVGRSSAVTSNLVVDIATNGRLRGRVVRALESDGVATASNGNASLAGIRVIAEDLSRAVTVAQLRKRLGGDRSSTPPTVVVSPACGPLGVRRALRAGAASVVLEDELERMLVPAVHAAAAGLSAVPVGLRSAADGLALSHREREVLRLAITGQTNGEIADTLFLAQSTVKSHLSSAYRKLGAGSRTDAASLVLDPDGGLLEMVWPDSPRLDLHEAP